jgi:hypothetical protein
MMKLSLLFAASCIFQSVQAADVFMTLNYETKLLSPDGFARNVTTVNGEFPGPTIRYSICRDCGGGNNSGLKIE